MHSLNFQDLSNVTVITHNRLTLRIRNMLLKMINYSSLSMRKFDAIVEIGGSIFQQQVMGRFLLPYRRANVTAFPYFVIGSNFGPYFEKKFVLEHRAFFAHTVGTVFRDKFSYDLFRDLPNVSYAPDVVFNLSVPSNALGQANHGKVLVIAPIDLSLSVRANFESLVAHKQEYEKNTAKIISKFLEFGEYVQLLPFSMAEGDGEAAKRIKAYVPEQAQSRVSILTNLTADQKVSTIADCDYFVGSRFHAMILAWLLQRPSLIISYSKKTNHVKSDLFEEQYFMSVSEFSDANLEFDFSQMNTISPVKLKKIQDLARLQFKYLDEFLTSV